MEKGLYKNILIRLSDMQGAYQDRILSGNLNIEEYKNLSGKFLGLIEAEECVRKSYKDLFENLYEDET